MIISVILLEFLVAMALIAADVIHERDIQYAAFDANLRAASNSLLGAVQEGVDDDVMLDLTSLKLGRRAIFQVTDERAHVLGSLGVLPAAPFHPGAFLSSKVKGRSYRFFTVTGQRVIDPDRRGGVRHQLTVVYGQPDGFVWHEVAEAVQFGAVSTVLLLGGTALLLVWLIRRLLAPIHELAQAAGEVTATQLRFNPPPHATNVKELRPLVVALQTALAKVERAFEQQKRFTSDAAHELKTDLAIVKSSLQLMALKRRTVEEHEQGLLAGLEDLARLEGTVLKMLALAKLEQSATGGRHVCRIDEMVRDAVDQSRPFAEFRAVHITTSLCPPAVVPFHRADALLLCSNILMNALQHSPEGGSVDIDSSLDHQSLRLTFRDHGEGIREEEAEALFQPFYRSDTSRSRKSGGTGLGLSICKAICDRAGGTIAIANHREGGALVSVVLPVVGSFTLPSVSLKG